MGNDRGRKDLHADHGERARRAGVVRAYRALYGDVCPGWGIAPHSAHDLTADHVIPHAVLGHGHGPLGVLCRSCNSRKGKRLGMPDPTPAIRSRDWVD